MYTFTNLCDGRYFTIPENQRGFSWSKKEVDALFNDLLLARTNSHYMGPVIVSRTDEPDFADNVSLRTTAEFTLEDGQQRLTTFFLIANELRLRLIVAQNGETIASDQLDQLIFFTRGIKQPRLRNSNADLNQHLLHHLLRQVAPPPTLTPPMASLEEAIHTIRVRLQMADVQSLIEWKNRIANKAKFIWVDLREEGVDRYLAFDAINSRGLPLSEFDKIKNFCILVDNKRNLNLHADTRWYEAIAHLEAFGVSSRADEASFITELYSVFFNERVGREHVHSRFVENFGLLLSESQTSLQQLLQEFVSLWESYAHSFAFITSSGRPGYYGDECTKGAGDWLDRLDNLNLAAITRPVLTASHHQQMSPADFERVARYCEIYTFRLYAVVGRRKDFNGQAITQLANQLLRELKDADYVGRMVCLWLSNEAPLRDVIAELCDGKAKYHWDENVKGWAYGYYFLYEYELDHSPGGVTPQAWARAEVGKRSSVEHILPQSHRDQGWWQTEWPDEAVADRFKHRLGNLTLTANNAVLGRKRIELKLLDPDATHYYNHQRATNSERQIREFTDGSEWKKEHILRREFEMLKFAAKRWSIPCCVDNGTINLPDEFIEVSSSMSSIVVAEEVCLSHSANPEADEGSEDGEDVITI